MCKSSTVINLTTLCYNEQLSDKHAGVNQNELIPRRHAAQMESGIGCPLLAFHPYSAVCHNLCWQLAAFLKECPLTRQNKFTAFWLVTSILCSQKKQTASRYDTQRRFSCIMGLLCFVCAGYNEINRSSRWGKDTSNVRQPVSVAGHRCLNKNLKAPKIDWTKTVGNSLIWILISVWLKVDGKSWNWQIGEGAHPLREREKLLKKRGTSLLLAQAHQCRISFLPKVHSC